MLILGCDFETTGLIEDDKTPSVIEVGMVLWDTDLRLPVKAMGYLVDPGPDAIWDADLPRGNGLTKETVAKHGYPSEKALRQFLQWYLPADVACAHNGNLFDRIMLKRWAEKLGYDWQSGKLWIDTNTDIEFPLEASHRLTYMAADHNFLNPFPHRAVFDVMTMLKVLDGYDLEKVLAMARSPMVTVKAVVDYDHRELAKSRGYRAQYEGGKFKAWVKGIKECKLEAEIVEAGFIVEILR